MVYVIRSFILAALVGLCGCAEPMNSWPPGPGEAVQERIGGTVAERLDAGGYAYLRVHTASSDRWVVVSGTAPDRGQDAEFQVFARHRDFVSRRLDRTFDDLSFATTTTQEPKP